METLSENTISEVKRLLPAIRRRLKQELKVWPDNKISIDRIKDVDVLAVLKYAARDYIILGLHVNDPDLVTPDNVVRFLNANLQSKYLENVISHAFRLLVMQVTTI